MNDSRSATDRYECVEPRLGERLADLALPDLPAEKRRELENHLRICDACRWRHATHDRLAAGLTAGDLHLPGDGRGRRPGGAWPRGLAGGGLLAVAAGLALVFLLPPTSPADTRLSRSGEADLAFRRPVEGEVLCGRTPGLSWTPLAGASDYRITVEAVGGDYRWQTVTEEARVDIPTDRPLPRDARLRAIVRPRPADLARTGGTSVSFLTAGARRCIVYRCLAAPRGVQWLTGGGLLALAGAVIGSLARRRG